MMNQPAKCIHDIVVAEDEDILQNTFTEVLTDAGYKVRSAYNGEEALVKIRDAKPGLLLLDIMMPKKDGFEVLQEMRNDPFLSDLPVIVLTNLEGAEQIAKAQSLGAVDYLVKANLEVEQIVQIVQRYCPACSRLNQEAMAAAQAAVAVEAPTAPPAPVSPPPATVQPVINTPAAPIAPLQPVPAAPVVPLQAPVGPIATETAPVTPVQPIQPSATQAPITPAASVPPVQPPAAVNPPPPPPAGSPQMPPQNQQQ